ncbi:MAG: hypothetical protein ACOX58_07040 [Christensenellales bacterium]|jgi:hypothetical protein
MNKSILCMLCALMLAALMPCAAAGQAYVPLPVLRGQAQAGLTGTWDIKGWTVTVNLQPDLPQADACPLVRVKLPGDLRHLIPKNASDKTLPLERDYDTAFRARSGADVFFVDTPENTEFAYEALPAGSPAEGSPLTWATAIDAVAAIVDPFLKETGPCTMTTSRRMTATTRTYRNMAEGMYRWDLPELDRSTPLTLMGFYDLHCLQTFHGIPLLGITSGSWADKATRDVPLPRGSIDAAIATPEDYMISLSLARYDALLADDLPLAPFARIVQEIERILDDGLAWSISGLRFGTLCFHDPDNVGSAYLLVPVWELQGRFVEQSSSPFPDPADPFLPISLRDANYQTCYIHAQTGAFLNPMDQTPGHSLAEIITWEQVGK